MAAPRRAPSYGKRPDQSSEASEVFARAPPTSPPPPVPPSSSPPPAAAPAPAQVVHVHHYDTPPAQPAPPSPARKSGWGGAIAGIIVLVIIVAIVASIRTATIEIGVVNTSLFTTKTIRVAVDGLTIHENSYSPGYGPPQLSHRAIWLGGSCISKVVAADGIDGFIDRHDSKSVSVCSGDSTSVTLFV